jgi:hypothetical protein
MKKHKRQNKLKGISGWLMLVLILFFCSALNALYMLIQRIVWAFTRTIGTGVYISMFFFLIYSVLLGVSICLILMKKKKAIKFSIIALTSGIVLNLWYYLIGQLIFNPYYNLFYIPTLLVNLIILIGIMVYIKKSRRVKNTFVR